MAFLTWLVFCKRRAGMAFTTLVGLLLGTFAVRFLALAARGFDFDFAAL